MGNYSIEHDIPPFMWAGDYISILKNGGDKFPLINELRNLLTGDFKVVLKLSKINDNLYVNGKPCLARKRKNAPITVYPNVKILEGTDAGVGGSNTYPNISFKEGYAIVEIITKGFPHMDLKTYRMNIEILELTKIA